MQISPIRKGIRSQQEALRNSIFAGIRELRNQKRRISAHLGNGTSARREDEGRKPIAET